MIGMGKSKGVVLSDSVADVAQPQKRPEPAEQLQTGTVVVHPVPPAVDSVAIYARVSRADQKVIWSAQVGCSAERASGEQLNVIRSVTEIDLVIGHRARIIRLLSDPAVQAIVLGHRDRSEMAPAVAPATITLLGAVPSI